MTADESAKSAGSAVIASPVAAGALRRFTAARVGLGRAGSSLPTRSHLEFVGDHARARDAVWTAVDFDPLAESLERLGVVPLRLRSQATDRAAYLRRPDLGRCLDERSTAALVDAARSPASRIVLVIADGLSAEAVQANAVPVVAALLPCLATIGVRRTSAALVEQGRVAVGDPIGEALGAELAIVLIGERPGLSAADSLGCYVTWSPRPGTPDSRRNCISNIRDGGLRPDDAAGRIARLAARALEQRQTGVALKEDGPAAGLPQR